MRRAGFGPPHPSILLILFGYQEGEGEEEPMNLPKVPHCFLIKHSTAGTYFKKMQGVKPVFGAAPDAEQFESFEAADTAKSKFPSVAKAMCDVVPWRKM